MNELERIRKNREAHRLLDSTKTLAANLDGAVVTSDGIVHPAGDLTPSLNRIREAIQLLEETGALPPERHTISVHFFPGESEDVFASRLAEAVIQLHRPSILHLFPDGNSASLRAMYTVSYEGSLPPREVAVHLAGIPGVKVCQVCPDRKPAPIGR